MNVVMNETYLLGEKTPRSNDEMIMRYRENVQQFGFSGRTLLYPDEKRYETKLGKYISLLESVAYSGGSVLDVGCGYGSLAEHLFRYTSCTYVGIDIVPEFIEHAQHQHVYKEKTNISFANIDLALYTSQNESKFDWCVLLGVLNSVPYPNDLVNRAWDTCDKGIFFDINSLEMAGITRYNTFDIPQYIEQFEALGASVQTSNAWDGCTILEIRKKK